MQKALPSHVRKMLFNPLNINISKESLHERKEIKSNIFETGAYYLLMRYSFAMPTRGMFAYWCWVMQLIAIMTKKYIS